MLWKKDSAILTCLCVPSQMFDHPSSQILQPHKWHCSSLHSMKRRRSAYRASLWINSWAAFHFLRIQSYRWRCWIMTWSMKASNWQFSARRAAISASFSARISSRVCFDRCGCHDWSSGAGGAWKSQAPSFSPQWQFAQADMTFPASSWREMHAVKGPWPFLQESHGSDGWVPTIWSVIASRLERFWPTSLWSWDKDHCLFDRMEGSRREGRLWMRRKIFDL